MKRFVKQFPLLLFFLCCRQTLFSQYILNGSAQKNSCNCYTLTQATTFQSGSVWNGNKISLNNSFDFWFKVFLGCNDANGADGIVFMLQPISTSVGSSGEGMGFAGVSPSIGITLDTWQNPNLNDPAFDHISIQANGIVAHGNDLAGPVPISSTSDNVEDCQWHTMRITWDANTKWLRTFFDGVLRLQTQIDLVTAIFNNDPNIYWGFAGATGGAINLQQFCTALDPLFVTNFPNNTGCEGIPVVFTDASISFAPIVGYNWSFGDGITSTLAAPPPHLYSSPGSYVVNLKITGKDGCENDSTKTITIAANPSATPIKVFDTCFEYEPRLLYTPQATVNYQWQLDGTATTGNPAPSLSNLSTGSHQLQVVASSNYGCGQPVVSTTDFFIKPAPLIDADVHDGCANELLSFNGLQLDNVTTIGKWRWQIGSNSFLTGQKVQTVFDQQGLYNVRLWAVADNGCTSDTVGKTIKIAKAFLKANDTTVLQNVASQLNVQTNGSVSWQPFTGLSNPSVANPFVTLNNNQTYTVTATTPEGCTASDTLLVKVFTGPTVYVPTAFTPNGDGRNDVLLPVYVGIKELKLFAVFNRWGQMMFHTNDAGKGWDGNDASGTFVWLISAVNYLGQPVLLKGTVTVIR